jgi:nicotinamidase-related amidase
LIVRAFGLDIPQSLADIVRPEAMALVVYDMQAGIVGQIANGGEIARRVLEVIESARAAGLRIIYTRHMSLPNEIAGISQLRTGMAWQHAARPEDVRPMFLRGSPAFELIPELAPRASEAVFDKITMSAFAGTPLDIALRDAGIIAFAIVGIALEVGIEPTVRHALDLGYIAVVVSDACGYRDEAAARRAFDGFAFTGGSFTTDAATLCELLQHHGRASNDASTRVRQVET